MIAKAHELLSDKDVQLPELTPLPEPGATNARRSAMQIDVRREAISFGRDVAPVLSRHCGNCHIRESRGELSLANYQSILQGAGSGPAVTPGRPDESVLLQMIESGEMPPQRGRGGGAVPPSDVQLIRTWIEQGAQFDGSNPTMQIDQVIAEAQRTPPPASSPSGAAPETGERPQRQDYGYSTRPVGPGPAAAPAGPPPRRDYGDSRRPVGPGPAGGGN
jgi:hypothetical protein